MAQKPKIEYVGRYYVYGSEAQELAPAPKKPRFTLPKVHLKPLQQVYIDPLALVGMILAVTMLAALVVGVLQLNSSWEAHDAMKAHLDTVKIKNTELTHTYNTTKNLEAAGETAENFDMVPASEVEHIKVHVKVPKVDPEPTQWDNFVWFLSGLFANAKK